MAVGDTLVNSGVSFSSTGGYNTLVGSSTGNNYVNTESSNILIGSGLQGTATESNVLRIGLSSGTSTQQINAAYIAGIGDRSLSAAGSMIIVDSNNKLGTDSSTINIATAATAKAVTLGTTTSTSSLALKFGTGDFSLASATGNAIVAQDTGEVTFPLQSSFLAYIASNVNNVTGAGASYTLGSTSAFTEVFDRNSDFNTNGTFTAPVTGIYCFHFVIKMTGITAMMTAAYTQITTTARSYQGGNINPAALLSLGGAVDVGFSTLVTMSAGDTATFSVVISNGLSDSADVVGSSSPLATYISGYLVA